jgi:hypothetical protein
LSLFLLFVVVVLFSLLSEFIFLSHDPCRRLGIEFELLFIGYLYSFLEYSKFLQSCLSLTSSPR